MSNITINTDASFSLKYKRGSYAFWISSDGGRFFNSGMLRDDVNTPVLCEMKCIINAFFFVVKYNVHQGVKSIVVNTDCLNAIHVFNFDKKAMKRYRLNNVPYLELQSHYAKLVDENFKGFKIEFRHVKSHEHTKTARNYVNDWCDRECKKHMGEFIESQEMKNYKLERLLNGETFITSEKGNSMVPLIKSGQEHKIAPVKSWEECNEGDIVYCKVRGKFYTHLVKAKNNDKGVLIGNNKGFMNGWTKQVYGKVIEVL